MHSIYWLWVKMFIQLLKGKKCSLSCLNTNSLWPVATIFKKSVHLTWYSCSLKIIISNVLGLLPYVMYYFTSTLCLNSCNIPVGVSAVVNSISQRRNKNKGSEVTFPRPYSCEASALKPQLTDKNACGLNHEAVNALWNLFPFQVAILLLM